MTNLGGFKYSGVKTPFQSDLQGREPIRIITSKRKRQTSFIVATWNVRTLTDSPKTKHPERRTGLIAKELHRFNVDIAALTETRFLNEGSLSEKKTTLFFGTDIQLIKYMV